MKHNLAFEQALWNKDIQIIAGVDEVGRGALAGPMVACAIILNPVHLNALVGENQGEENPAENNDVSSETIEVYKQIKDSKLLSPKKRAFLSEFIKEHCIGWAVFEVSNREIDKQGIAHATQTAFAGAVEGLMIKPEFILTDAFAIKKYSDQIQTNIISGDRKSLSISAASIVAKVYRDNLMVQLSKRQEFNHYGFEQHKGYGTRLHLANIQAFGISNLHRISFIH